MINAKTIRKFIGILGILIFLIPLSGFPGSWKDTFTMIFGVLVFLSVASKPIIIEVFRFKYELKRKRRSFSSHGENKEQTYDRE